MLSAFAFPGWGAVFINEIHYDNSGTDAGEAVEVAGPAGTDLSGWSIALYNGSTTQLNVYDTINLSGTIPNQQNGFGTLSFPRSGIQNGAPDGLALVDAGSAVIQFLSYEGTFTAASGPAVGMTSVDIGVAEGSGTPVGDSLQLVGTGSVAGDFTWAASMPNTFGAVNTGQTFVGGAIVDPVINEFVFNHTGTDTHEFVEAFGQAATDYSAFTILEIEGDGSGQGTIDGVFPIGTTDAGGLWDTGFLANVIENGTVTLLLVEGFTGAVGGDVDADNDGLLDTAFWTRIVDDVAVTDGTAGDGAYSGVVLAPGFDGISFAPGGASRIPNATDTDSVGDWVRNDFDGEGLPGFAGTPDPGEALNTPGAENELVPVAGEPVVLSEIRIDQPGGDDDEYFELAGSPGTSLDGLTYLVIGDGSGGSGVIENVTALAGHTIPATGFFVAAESSFTLGTADLVTALNFENSDNVTHLLVTGFTGASGQDLDVDDDGVLDVEPWSELVDCVGLVETVGSGDRIYCPTTVGPDGSFVPGHAYRCAEPWQIGEFDPAVGVDSPGRPNACLVINEIDYDQPSTDLAEFVEIMNRASTPLDLGSVALELVNGSGGGAVVYQSISLPAVSLAGGDYFVVCSDASTVATCDLQAIGSIQNGAPDAVALTSGGQVIDTVSYEGDTGAPYTEGSGSGLADSGATGEDFRGISRFPDGADSNRNNVDLQYACITPGRANTNLVSDCTETGPRREIFEIQGAGLDSPFEGQTIRTDDNVVTAVGVDGFFIQTPAIRSDGDVDTSDGIFVFTGGAPGVAAGDLVDVVGTVQEFFGFTEFGFGSGVTISGAGTVPAPVPFDAAVPSPDPAFPSCAIEYECYEGMLVEIAEGTVTGPNQRFGTDPIAEVHIVARTGRAYREPGIEFPGLFGFPVWDGNPEVFELDPDKLGLANLIIPAGSTFNATGAIGFEFGGYELWPTELDVDYAPLPVPVRPRDPGEFTVATLNLFRLFDDVDDPADGDRDDQVVSTAEWERRRFKLAAHIVEVLDSPDVLAVQEAEKLEVLETLAGDVNALDPTVVYSAYLVEGNDIGTIDVGFLVRQRIAVDAVTQLGKAETFIDPTDGSVDILHDRPPLLLEGRCELEFGYFPIAVMVVHNRSLGSIDDPFDGPRVRQKRYEQAVSIAEKVQALQDADPSVRLVVAGDFNAFEFSDGYVDAVGIIKGDFVPGDSLVCDTNLCDDLVEPDLFDEILAVDPAERYSFIFGGSAQVLDHALTSAGLAAEIGGAEFGRGNADAAVDLINDDVDPAIVPLRSTDHDGLVVYIVKDFDADGVPNDDDVCPGTVIPEGVPTQGLVTNRYALVDGDGVFDTEEPSGNGPGDVFTLGDTAGCSCEQIIAAQGLGQGHVRHGCSLGAMRNWVDLVNP